MSKAYLRLKQHFMTNENKKGKRTTTTITIYENKQKKILPGHIHRRKALRRRLLFHICKGTETGIDSKHERLLSSRCSLGTRGIRKKKSPNVQGAKRRNRGTE